MIHSVSRLKLLPLTLECVFLLLCGVQAAVDLPPVEGKTRLSGNLSTAGWTSLEDEVLRRTYQKHGEDEAKWRKMSGCFTNRNPRQCRDRWRHSLDPHNKYKRRGRKKPSTLAYELNLAEDIFDSEYRELVGKSDLVKDVSFHSTETLVEFVVDSILFSVGCRRSAAREGEEKVQCAEIKEEQMLDHLGGRGAEAGAREARRRGREKVGEDFMVFQPEG